MRPKDLSTGTRNQIVQFLLMHLINGRPARGKMIEAATKFGVCRKTVTRSWAEAKKQQHEGQVIHLSSSRKHSRVNKRVHIDLNLIESIDLPKRSTIRKLAKEINCSKSTVWRWVKRGMIKAHTSAIRPSLTEPNKLLRLRFSLEALEFDRILNILRFKCMQNTIHIDEKWFYITRSTHRFYLTPGEAEPHRSCKSKKFITKVMFMCAVCRPIFAQDGSVLFDGKIGIFPFIQRVAAVRTSKNRPAGTLETKPIESITKDVIKECLINKILPAIRSKWPAFANKRIYIQQDNARPHIKDCDADFRVAATIDGFDIRLVNQPPNSPDTNVNDLGWFRAIQSIQVEASCYNVDQLVNAVISSFEQLSPMTLNKVFLSLQGCMMEIMKVRGHNSYKLPHMKKDQLISQDALPTNLEVPDYLVRECISYMVENGIIEDIRELKSRLRM